MHCTVELVKLWHSLMLLLCAACSFDEYNDEYDDTMEGTQVRVGGGLLDSDSEEEEEGQGEGEGEEGDGLSRNMNRAGGRALRRRAW